MTKNDQVLHLLKQADGKSVSGEEMSRKIGVSRAAVWKEIQTLRSLGYEIQAQPHLGYQLTRIPDKLFADEIADSLGTKFIGKPIFSYEDLDSTNDTVFKLGEEGLAEGAAVFTEHQKKAAADWGALGFRPKERRSFFPIY